MMSPPPTSIATAASICWARLAGSTPTPPTGADRCWCFTATGNGTFGTPVAYPTAIGAIQIVAGDFNRDGVVDVATGNRSSIGADDCGATLKTWDSVSILIGRRDGTFAPAWNFSVGDQSLMDFTNPQVDRYRNTLSSLNTSDLNGDRATDLIASNGAILFNVPAVPNRPPTVDAGPDTALPFDSGIAFRRGRGACMGPPFAGQCLRGQLHRVLVDQRFLVDGARNRAQAVCGRRVLHRIAGDQPQRGCVGIRGV
jgi:FG-GAP-like repeat